MVPGSSNFGSFFDQFLGPIWTPRNVKIRKKCGFAGSPKRIPQKDTFQGHQKCDFAIIYYTLARSEMSQKGQFWVFFGTPFWHQITKTGVSERLQKKDPKSSHIWVLFWDPSERVFASGSTPWHSQCRAWRVEPQKQSIWLPQGLQTMSKSIQKVYQTQDSVAHFSWWRAPRLKCIKHRTRVFLTGLGCFSLPIRAVSRICIFGHEHKKHNNSNCSKWSSFAPKMLIGI